MIRFYGVSKKYAGDVTALHDVNLEIERGEFVFITGRSGAGKTSMLRLMLRQELPTTGQVIVNGRNVAALPASKVPELRREQKATSTVTASSTSSGATRTARCWSRR